MEQDQGGVAAATTAPGGPVKLLVVDDEPDVKLLITQRFRRQIRGGEYEFLFALNGREALDRLTEHPDVSVVLTDINMPEMDGLTLLARLGRVREDDLQAVVVTAYDDMTNIRAAMNGGAVDFLTKPIDFTDLDKTLRKAVEFARLANERRRLQAEKLRAEAASEAKSMFLAAMSHEIRNPMNAIVGMCELLREADLAPPERRYTELLESSCSSLLRLLEDVLDLSRVQAGRLELERAPFELEALLEEVASIVEVSARGREVRIARRFGALPARVWGDPGRLRQVLLNLLGNAIKFSPEQGEVTLTAELTLTAEPHGAELALAVADRGVGIPAERLEAVFEAFVQAERSTARRFGGAGLGLAISREIVTAMGGRIWVESEVGRGSTFHVRAPLALDGDAPSPGAAGPPAPSRGLRVLHVDDDEDGRFLVERFLSGSPHTVGSVSDGAEALRRITSGEAWDLLLLDMNMPVLDGYATARAIRAWEAGRGAAGRGPPGGGDLPIVALTAYASASERARCLEAGCTDHLVKPIKKLELLSALARWSHAEP